MEKFLKALRKINKFLRQHILGITNSRTQIQEQT